MSPGPGLDELEVGLAPLARWLVRELERADLEDLSRLAKGCGPLACPGERTRTRDGRTWVRKWKPGRNGLHVLAWVEDPEPGRGGP